MMYILYEILFLIMIFMLKIFLCLKYIKNGDRLIFKIYCNWNVFLVLDLIKVIFDKLIYEYICVCIINLI